MGRADTVTKLPIDRWADIIGLDPFHFNGIFTALRPDRACNTGEDFWLQQPWMAQNKVSREDLAASIQEAEALIENEIGYYLLPDWTVDERHETERPGFRELFSAGINPRWLGKSLVTSQGKYRHGYWLSGGVRAKSVIQAAAVIVRSDADGDGYQELCTVTVASTISTEEVRVYFAGQSGADEWEIRPIKVVASGGNLVITFGIWQVPNPALWLALNATGIDGDVALNFQTTVDVYRVYNDPSQQATLMWEPDPLGQCTVCGGTGCAVCAFAVQTACLHGRDPRLGIVVYTPAEWSATDLTFSASDFSVCREPEHVRLWYYSGWRWEKASQSAGKAATRDMEPYWENAVANLAAALLSRDVCACNNTSVYVDSLREDLARNGREVSFQNAPDLLSNTFGTMRGAVYAWKRTQQEGRKIQP